MSKQTIKLMRAEAARLRALADKLDALIIDLQQDKPHELIVNDEIDGSLSTTDLTGCGQDEACFRVLRDANSPLKRDEIIKRANARGAGIRHAPSISSVLSRSSRFHNVGSGLWKVKS